MSTSRENKNLTTKIEKLVPLTMKNDVTHANQLNCMNERTKSRFEVIVTSYGCNKNLDDQIAGRPKIQSNELKGQL